MADIVVVRGEGPPGAPAETALAATLEEVYSMPSKNPQEPFWRISLQEAQEMMKNGSVQLVDVREPWEYQKGHIPGAQLIPVGSVFARRGELSRETDIVFACAVGQRSALACEMAAAAGLTRLYNLEGGTKAWQDAGLPLEY